MDKLIISRKDIHDLSIGFDRRPNKRRDKLAQRNVKGKHHLRIMFRDFFGFAECQEKATYGLVLKLTSRRNKDDAVKDKTVGTADARIKIDHIH